MTAKRKSKGACMISPVAEMYGIDPPTGAAEQGVIRTRNFGGQV